jgi:Na+-driven multidrug efflux pump
MKTQQENKNNILFRLASRFLKYLLLFVFGLAIAFVLSSIVGLGNVTQMLLPVIADLLSKLTVLLICLFAAAIILESLLKK